MNCCVNCFSDTHIRSTIENLGRIGDCDFCCSQSIAICDVSDPDNPISDKIIGLLQIYSVSNNPEAKLISRALREDWDIFSLESDTIMVLIRKICENMESINSEIFSQTVVIEQLSDPDFLDENCVVRGNSWDQFSESIKHCNRFHNGMFNPDAFASILSIIRKTYNQGASFYRARISADHKGFEKGEMGAPPMHKRTAGRINPEGIGALYLSSDKLTALNEARASAFDYVSIGEFKATRKIKIADLSGVGTTSPFIYSVELDKFAVNRAVFRDIAAEIAKPIRRSDSLLEYLPTQFISEFIKSQEFDGVEYASTLKKGGYNLAVFNSELIECINVEIVEVSEISYATEPSLGTVK